MRSLQEWMKYLEQQEESVKQKPEEETPPEPVQTSVAQETVVAEPPVRPTQPTRPIEPEQPRQIVSPVQPAPQPKVDIPVPPQPEPAAVKPVVAAPVQTVTPQAAPSKPAQPVLQSKPRKPRTPKPVLQHIAQQETAQKSYKPFRESREDLLQKLLDPMISLEEAARILNVCPTTVRRYTNRGILKHHRTAGNQRRFRLSDVLAFMGTDIATEIAEQ